MADSAIQNDRKAVAFALVFPTIVTLLYFVWLGKLHPTLAVAAYGPLKVLQFGFPLLWYYGVQRRRTGVRDANKKQAMSPAYAKSAAAGIAFGLLVLGAALAVYYAGLKPSGFFAASSGAVLKKTQEMGLTTPARFLAVALFYALGHSLLEEYYWRWFVFGQCRRRLSLPLGQAILISSLGFMAHHVVVLAEYFQWTSPATYLFSAAVAIGGACWAWIYERYGTLLGPWLSHLLIDAVIFAIGYDLVFG